MNKEKLTELITPYFISNGYKSYRVDDIANELKISKLTIYKIFRSKKEMIDAVLKNRQKQAREHYKEIENTADNAVDELLRFFDMLVNYNPLHRQQSNVAELKRYYATIYESNAVSYHKMLSKQYCSILKRGQQQKLMSKEFDPKCVGDLFAGAYLQHIFDENKFDAQKELKFILPQLVRVFVYAVLNDEGRKYLNSRTDLKYPIKVEL